MDTFTPQERSEIMRKVKSRDTKPEMVVRRLVHRLGYRYRLHRKDLPGKPDLTFVSRPKLIFVHGCFWHNQNRDIHKSRQAKAVWRGHVATNIRAIGP